MGVKRAASAADEASMALIISGEVLERNDCSKAASSVARGPVASAGMLRGWSGEAEGEGGVRAEAVKMRDGAGWRGSCGNEKM